MTEMQEIIADELITEVTKQFKEDLGTEPVSPETEFLIRQKYGLTAPQLTLSELNLIRWEERNAGRR
jgi:hypothetical protein